jgi:hypothetical protein
MEAKAFDTRSAYWRASDAFEEARAILLLLSHPVVYGSTGNYFALADDGRSTIRGSAPSHTPNLFVSRVDGVGIIWPRWRALSAAARKSRDERTEWEGRALGAARWDLHAMTSSFPSASLVAGMSALEALLLGPRDSRRNKGKTLAARVLNFEWHVRGVPNDELSAWLRRLYARGRDAAAHEADFFDDERDVERLLALVDRVSARLGAHHSAGGNSVLGVAHRVVGHTERRLERCYCVKPAGLAQVGLHDAGHRRGEIAVAGHNGIRHDLALGSGLRHQRCDLFAGMLSHRRRHYFPFQVEVNDPQPASGDRALGGTQPTGRSTVETGRSTRGSASRFLATARRCALADTANCLARHLAHRLNADDHQGNHVDDDNGEHAPEEPVSHRARVSVSIVQ